MQTLGMIDLKFGVWLLFFIVSCSANNSETMTTSKNTIVVKSADEKMTRILNCANSNEYSFAVVENLNRKDEIDQIIPKDLNIQVGNEVKAKIELPDSEVKNFSLNSVMKTKAGFEVKVEWGGGLYHYEVQYNFRCKENNFYLYKVKTNSFSTKNSDSRNFWDKKETKETKIEPNLPIEKFVMTDYLD